VMEFYKTNPIDLFINVSSSEGIPVSIMEAQAFGVPVMATDVGGTAEIVNNENGILLPANPSVEAIADEISALIGNQTELKKKRGISVNNWKTYFNAEENYRNFSKQLVKI